VRETRRKNPKIRRPMEQTASDTSACATPSGKVVKPHKKRVRITKHVNKRTKLDDRMRTDVVKMLAEFIPIPQIKYELERKYQVSVSEQNLHEYKRSPRWAEMLSKFRRKYTEGLDSVPGYHKRVRLERMERVYQKADSSDDLKNSIAVTEHQRKEVEGDGNKHVGDNILIQFKGMSDDELQKELQNTIEYVKKLEAKNKPLVIDVEAKNGNV
jgi:hypothetical protein